MLHSHRSSDQGSSRAACARKSTLWRRPSRLEEVRHHVIPDGAESCIEEVNLAVSRVIALTVPSALWFAVAEMGRWKVLLLLQMRWRNRPYIGGTHDAGLAGVMFRVVSLGWGLAQQPCRIETALLEDPPCAILLAQTCVRVVEIRRQLGHPEVLVDVHEPRRFFALDGWRVSTFLEPHVRGVLNGRRLLLLETAVSR